jgi:predicted Zn-dependent protease
VLLLTFALGPLAEFAAGLAPRQFDRALGRSLYGMMVDSESVSSDAEAVAALDACVRAVLPEGRDVAEITTALVEDASVENAFALPGGYVVVYRGMLDRMEDEAELLGVLAHELGHVHERHGVKRLARSAGLSFLLAVTVGDAGGIAGALAQHSGQLVALAYDRDEERDADSFALAVMTERGFDPGQLARLLSRLEEPGNARSVPEILSTHPATSERMARLEEAALPGGSSRRVLSAEAWSALKEKPAGRQLPSTRSIVGSPAIAVIDTAIGR